MTSKIPFPIISSTTIIDLPQGEYWSKEELTLYKNINKKMPARMKWYDPRIVCRHFGLKAIVFGNWMTQSDRMQYLAATVVASKELSKRIGISENSLGKNKLVVSLGAAGRGGKSSAFYMPIHHLVNFKKSRGDKDYKESVHLETFQSFAHEYGHFLDHINSTNANWFYSSLGKGKQGEIMKLIKGLDWYKKLKKSHRGYWVRDEEVFARSFETYVATQTDRVGAKKYASLKKSVLYPSKADLKNTGVDKLFREFSKKK